MNRESNYAALKRTVESFGGTFSQVKQEGVYSRAYEAKAPNGFVWAFNNKAEARVLLGMRTLSRPGRRVNTNNTNAMIEYFKHGLRPEVKHV